MSDIKNIIKYWKDNNLVEARFIFTCGGDSMGDTEWQFTNDKGDCDVPKEIEDYFDNQVYTEVDFYVNSDGHYQGESGSVQVTLDEENEYEWRFSYVKSSMSEWSETHTSRVEYPLDEAEKAFVTSHVTNINGSSADVVAINFKHDFLMSDEEETILADLQKNIDVFVRDFTPEGDDVEGELEDWYSFSTSDGSLGSNGRLELTELEVVGNALILYINNTMTVFKGDD